MSADLTTTLIVAFLVVSPIEVPLPHKVPESIWDALKQIALKIEIVGPHERWRSDFRAELNYVRYHWNDLRNSPPIADRYRFPPNEMAQYCCFCNNEYQNYIRGKRFLHRHLQHEHEIYLQEARQLCLIWKTVYEATNTDASWASQRKSLRELLNLLGPESYVEGWLPPSAPIWRFRQIE